MGKTKMENPYIKILRNAPKYTDLRYYKPPGRIVDVIARKPKGLKDGEFNPLVIFWTVSPYRKDLNDVIEQREKIKKAQLPKYEADLFRHCFKNW